MLRLPPAASLRHLLLAFIVAALHFALAIRGSSNQSGTFDEFAHITGGYSYWAYNDYRSHPENGNWAQRIVAIPVVASDARFPSLDQPAWSSSDFWAISDQFFFGGANDPADMLRRGRTVVALFGAALCLLVFWWSRAMWGWGGAWVSLILVAFNPSMLAHSGLATSDIIATGFFVAATWALWTVLHRVTPMTVAASILATAGAFLSKYSAVILIPIAVTMLVIRLAGPKPLMVRLPARPAVNLEGARRTTTLIALTVAHIAAVVMIIWASYGFRYSAFNTSAGGGSEFLDPWAEVVSSSATSNVIQAARRAEVLPEAYLYGFSTVLAYSKNRSAFVNGRDSRDGGWRWFFPYAAAVKATLPSLLLILMVPLLLWARRRRRTGVNEDISAPMPWYDALPVLLLIVWYWVFAVLSTLNIGHRHLLPTSVATAILLGFAGEPITRFMRLMAASKSAR